MFTAIIMIGLALCVGDLFLRVDDMRKDIDFLMDQLDEKQEKN